MLKIRFQLLLLCLLALPLSSLHAQDWQQQIRSLVQSGSVLAVDGKGNVLFAYNADQPFVPASTLKVATALAALKILGPDFRFKTEFYTDPAGNLYVKGYGDPFLISEELSLIAKQLKEKGLNRVGNMVLDTSFFSSDVQVPGLAGSLNPYDAYNGAILANFNTIFIVKSSNGEIQSAESQTPLTEITKVLAQNAPYGKSRINVAMHEREAPLYAGYLLKEFLAQQGVPVTGSIAVGPLAPQASPFFAYRSTKNLQQVLTAGLEYSQNLIMNQLFLVMGAAKLGPPASLAKGKQVFEDFLKNEIGLKQINVEEGSGISRKNLVTALEMDKILVNFFPFYRLLPVKNGMWVKTGTLRGVASLVGYFQSTSRGWVRFVIILNQGSNPRDRIAHLLQENL